MPDPIRILQGLILSAAVAAAVVLIFGWPWRAPNQVRIRVGEVLGVGAGIWIGCRLFGVSTNWPLREDQDRLLCIVLPAVILLEFASAGAGRRASVVSRFSRLVVAVCAAPALLFHSSYVSDLSGPGSAEWSSRKRF